MGSGPVYTEAQLEEYLERIKYKPSTQDISLLQDVRQRIQTDALDILSDLQRRHLSSIPWGNSGLHYSQHHVISLNSDSLYEKLVERSLDGYCMENSGLFFNVLRSLGFLVYATGGRVSHAASTGINDGLFLSFGHMILIVIIDGFKYMVDTGFGNNGATAPLPLREGATATCIEPSEMRLVRENIDEFTDKTQKIWIYQLRYNAESKWLPMYCFNDVEFLPQDFEVLNFAVSQTRTSWFVQTFVCMRMILDEDAQRIIGQCIMSGREVKRRTYGQTEILQVLHTEEDRVKALAKYFDMHLRNNEIEGIWGLTSELR